MECGAEHLESKLSRERQAIPAGVSAPLVATRAEAPRPEPLPAPAEPRRFDAQAVPRGREVQTEPQPVEAVAGSLRRSRSVDVQVGAARVAEVAETVAEKKDPEV